MLRSIRLRNERSHNALALRRRAAALTFALMLTPCLIDGARAADIDTPRAATGYVATDSGEICTFWSGLGVETPFALTDDAGRPVSWRDWVDTVNVETYDRFFNNLPGLTFLISTPGQDWLRSPAGQAWAESATGRAWINDFVKSAPADRSGDYVGLCGAYGADVYFIPGTESCLSLGRYLRTTDANPVTNYESLRSALQSTTSSPFSDQALRDMTRAFTHTGILQSSTPQQDTNQPDPNWSGKIKPQRDFGGGSGDPAPTTQTSQQNGDASAANGTTSPNATSQAGGQADSKVTVRIFVKGHVAEGNPPGPPVPGQFVSLVGGNVEPDLPMSGTTRTAEQENIGSDKGAPQGKSDRNGIAKFKIDYGDVKNLMGHNYFRDGLKLTADYTLTGTVEVQKHGGFVAPAPDNTPAPTFSKGSLEGVSYQWNEYTIGTQKFWAGGYSVDYNVADRTADEIKQDIIATVREKLGPDIAVAFDGNICRVELPANVTGPYTPVPQKLTAGIPEATIKLSLMARRDGGAL